MTETLTPSCLGIDGETTLGEAGGLIGAELKRLGLFDELDYFNTDYQIDKATKLKDVLAIHFNWIAVWAVPGGSEGHYIHVELVGEAQAQEDRIAGRKVSRCIFLGKTFMGLDHAMDVVKALTTMVEW